MIYQVRQLFPDDSASLLALTQACAYPGDRMILDRSPDPFELSRHWAPRSEISTGGKFHGLFADRELVASCAMTVQQRFVGGNVTRTGYVHDVRVLPRVRGSSVYVRLIRHAIADSRESLPWVFATVLSDNVHLPTIQKGFGPYRSGRLLGSTRHVGVAIRRVKRPERTLRTPNVVELAADEAWRFYVGWANTHDMSPADPLAFRAADIHLAVIDQGAIQAVVAVAIEDQYRRFERGRALGLVRRFARFTENVAAGLLALPLPRTGAIPLAYLTFLATSPGTTKAAAVRRFVEYIRKRGMDRPRFLFWGEGVGDESATDSRLALRFNSHTLVFGQTPDGLSLGHHELLWM